MNAMVTAHGHLRAGAVALFVALALFLRAIAMELEVIGGRPRASWLR
jgi:hypothetical protein